MSEIKELLNGAVSDIACVADDTFPNEYRTITLLRSIASSLYVIARVVTDIDEVEEMYKDYPAGKKPTDSDWEKWRKNE